MHGSSNNSLTPVLNGALLLLQAVAVKRCHEHLQRVLLKLMSTCTASVSTTPMSRKTCSNNNDNCYMLFTAEGHEGRIIH
jgi:hypothetical protein